MQNIILTLKRVINFIFLALTVPWLNIALFFTLYSVSADKEMIDLIQEDGEILFENCYIISFFAFVLTYIIAIHFINKKTKLQRYPFSQFQRTLCRKNLF